MGFDFLSPNSEGYRHHESATAARVRLRAIEEEHERVLNEASPKLHDTGLEYASAVHEYSEVVMKWLIWIERHSD